MLVKLIRNTNVRQNNVRWCKQFLDLALLRMLTNVVGAIRTNAMVCRVPLMKAEVGI